MFFIETMRKLWLAVVLRYHSNHDGVKINKQSTTSIKFRFRRIENKLHQVVSKKGAGAFPEFFFKTDWTPSKKYEATAIASMTTPFPRARPADERIVEQLWQSMPERRFRRVRYIPMYPDMVTDRCHNYRLIFQARFINRSAPLV